MTVEILRILRNQYGHFTALLREDDGVIRVWGIGDDNERAPIDELDAIRIFKEEWEDPIWTEYKCDLEYREARVGVIFQPEDFEGTGLVV